MSIVSNRIIEDKYCFLPCPPERCNCRNGNPKAWDLQQAQLGKLATPSSAPHRNLLRSELLTLAAAGHSGARIVDSDAAGQPICDLEALLWSAYGPAVVRIVNMALTRHAPGEMAPVDAAQMLLFAPEAISQQADFDFAGARIADYQSLLTGSYSHEVLLLINLALKACQQATQVA